MMMMMTMNYDDQLTVPPSQGGTTAYTITVSAIVGNAKMKGVTTKVNTKLRWYLTSSVIL